MKKMHTNLDGFSSIEFLMVMVTLAIIGVAGYFVAKHIDKKNIPVASATNSTAANTTSGTPAPSANAPTATNPYLGWRTYTMQNEKLTFKYPSTWLIVGDSNSTDDQIGFDGPNDFSMIVDAGATATATKIPNGPIEQVDKVTFNGQTDYLDAVSSTSSKSGNVYEIILSTSATNPGAFPPTKNISANAANSRMVVIIDYFGPSDDIANTQPLSYFQNDINYKDAKLVIESMAY